MNKDKFFRRLDGRFNNRHHPEWGASETLLIRPEPARYADGISSLVTEPNPRTLSNTLCNQTEIKENNTNLSDFVWAWGQFLDHEIDLTEAHKPEERADVAVQAGDPHIPQGGVIPFKRSVYKTDKEKTDEPRQQINQLSAFIDAANVYGTDEERLKALRSNDGSGKLKVQHTENGDLLPINSEHLPNAMMPEESDPTTFFLAGDIRSNEHAVLTSMHTLFVREHNRLCEKIAQRHPAVRGDDDKIFHLARKLVGAIMQVITFKEFLPALLGEEAISSYQGYQTHVNPGVSNVFSTACYRLGHSMLPDDLVLGDGKKSIPLREAFFKPQLIREQGIEPFLEGRLYNKMLHIDLQISDSVRNFLFSPPNEHGQPFLDLASLNIQRGRDHGLADYNTVRQYFGLDKAMSFSDICSDVATQEKLQQVYQDIDEVDVWIGALAEDHKAGAQVGELLFTVIKDQFERLRDGDRFWYQNDPLLQHYQEQLNSITLAKVIRRNTHIDNVPDDVFRVAAAATDEKEVNTKSEDYSLN